MIEMNNSIEMIEKNKSIEMNTNDASLELNEVMWCSVGGVVSGVVGGSDVVDASLMELNRRVGVVGSVGDGVIDVDAAAKMELNRRAVGGAYDKELHMNQMQYDEHIMMHAAMEPNRVLMCGRW
jgi:hypothetical protein